MNDFMHGLLKFIAAVCLTLFVVLPLYIQSRLYYPTKQYFPVNVHYEDIFITTGDGVKINAWYSPPQNRDITVVFCHGNGRNLSFYQEMFRTLQQKGYGVLAIDYRGYGKSGGKPNEKGLYEDLRSGIQYLKTYRNTPHSNIVLWGLSMGGAVVSEIASENNDFRGVVLQSTFTNIREMTGNLIYRVYLGSGAGFSRGLADVIPMLQKYDTKSRIQLIKSPLLLAHSAPDDIVPVEMCKELAELKPDAQVYISETGGHNEHNWFYPRFFRFLESLEKPVHVCYSGRK